MSARTSVSRNRPQTRQDVSLLKTVRYEDAADGVPPVPVNTINLPNNSPLTPTTNNSSQQDSQTQSSAKRPRTSRSPSSRARAPLIAADEKRDSGIAPSISTAGRASLADSQISALASSAPKTSRLPTIVVQDDETPAERSRYSFGRRKSKDTQSVKARSVSPPKALPHVESFEGVQSEVPTGDFGNLGLEDLATDKIAFSPRGSLLFGGKRMYANREADGNGSAIADGLMTSIASDRGPHVSAAATPASDATSGKPEQSEIEDAQIANDGPKKGLVAGRRKPSIQMLQAALQGGRVLSAEEVSFSMRVRSMYEHGDERAAQWTGPQTTSATPVTDDDPTDASIDAVIVGQTSPARSEQHPALRAAPADPRTSYHREETELAGGVEDWGDVNGEDVDRYGFINPHRTSSRTSMTSGQQERGFGMQRVATSLQIQGVQPRRERRLRRGNSILSRSSRSVPPRSSRDDTIRDGTASSIQSNRSTGHVHSNNPFRSRDRRTLAEAADMLTLPPGLADIAEQEDAGKTASALKRREWSREEKWQKMARPTSARTRSKSLGGGMHFEFDTREPKLANRTWKGIPDRWRASAWHSFLSASHQKRGIGLPDAELVARFHALQEQSSADDVQIDVDVPRTINMHIMFRRRYRGGQRLLFRVLHAISLFFPDTGYVQGMASLAATLLCYYAEDTAFVMLVRLWQLRGLEQLFQAGFEGLMTALHDFETHWLGSGDVARQLNALAISPTAYGTRWYLTLFNMSVPFPAQLRVWDVFMLLGDAPAGTTTPTSSSSAASSKDNAFGGADLDVLHATSAALIDATREILLDSDFENAMKVLTSFVPVKDEDLLMRVAKAEWKLRKKRGALPPT